MKRPPSMATSAPAVLGWAQSNLEMMWNGPYGLLSSPARINLGDTPAHPPPAQFYRLHIRVWSDTG
jgi:hypothetical protein